MALEQDRIEDFYSGRRSASMPFVVNDSVVVVNGPNVGRTGAVISPEPKSSGLAYLVESGDESGDFEVEAELLKFID